MLFILRKKMENDNRTPTKFNMAIATLENMHNLLKLAIIHSLQGDFINWYEDLRALRRDISPFITDNEFNEIESRFNEIDNTHWIHYNDKTKKKKVMPGKIGFIYNNLDALHIYMRRAMNNSGLLMPKSDDPMFALEV